MFFKDQLILFLIIRAIYQDHNLLFVLRKKYIFGALNSKLRKSNVFKNLYYRNLCLNLKVSLVLIKIYLILKSY